MHRSTSWRCGLVDKHWGRVTSLYVEKILVEVEHFMAHRTGKDKKEVSHFEKFVIEGNEQADVFANEGALLDEGFMAQTRAKTVQQQREEVCAALRYAASLRCVVEERKDCEELKLQPKERWTFLDKKRGSKTSNGTVCKCQQVSMHEMWKRQQVYEKYKEHAQDQSTCQKLRENGECDIWQDTIW